jgi:RimJ/RimL family protein N-acetyltransferase
MRLEKIYGYVISNNYKMIRVCDKKGFKMETLDEDTIKVSLALS